MQKCAKQFSNNSSSREAPAADQRQLHDSTSGNAPAATDALSSFVSDLDGAGSSSVTTQQTCHPLRPLHTSRMNAGSVRVDQRFMWLQTAECRVHCPFLCTCRVCTPRDEAQGNCLLTRVTLTPTSAAEDSKRRAHALRGSLYPRASS